MDKIIAAILTVVLMPFQALLPTAPASGPFPRPNDAAAVETTPPNSPLIESASQALGLPVDFILKAGTWVDYGTTNDGTLANSSWVNTGPELDFRFDKYLQADLKLVPPPLINADTDPRSAQRKFAGDVIASKLPPSSVRDVLRQLFEKRVQIMQEAPNAFLAGSALGAGTQPPQYCGAKKQPPDIRIAFFSGFNDAAIEILRSADKVLRDGWYEPLKKSGLYPDLDKDATFQFLFGRARYAMFVKALGEFTQCLNSDSCSGDTGPAVEASPLKRFLALFQTPVALADFGVDPFNNEKETYAFKMVLARAVAVVKRSPTLALNGENYDLIKYNPDDYLANRPMIGRILDHEIAISNDGHEISFNIYFPESLKDGENGARLEVTVNRTERKLTKLVRSAIPDTIEAPSLQDQLNLKAPPPPEAPPLSPYASIKIPPTPVSSAARINAAYIASQTPIQIDGRVIRFTAEDIAGLMVGEVQFLDPQGELAGFTIEIPAGRLISNPQPYYVRYIIKEGKVLEAKLIPQFPPRFPMLTAKIQPKDPRVELPTVPESPVYTAVTSGKPNVKRLTSIARYGLRSIPLRILDYIRGRTAGQLAIGAALTAGETVAVGAITHFALLAINGAKDSAFNHIYCTSDDIPEIPGGWRIRNCSLGSQNLVIENDGSRAFVLENTATSGKFALHDMPNLERIVIERLNPGDHTASLIENNPGVLHPLALPDPGVDLTGVGTANTQRGLSIEFNENEWGTLPTFNTLRIPYDKPVSISFRNHNLTTAAPIVSMLKPFIYQNDIEIRIPGRASDLGSGNPICDPTKAVDPSPTNEQDYLLKIERDILWQEVLNIDAKRLDQHLSPLSSHFYCEAGPSWEKK